jgi:ribonuclease Y
MQILETLSLEEFIFIEITAIIFVSYIGFLFGKNVGKGNSGLFIKQAKAKAKSIEKEAEYLLKEARVKAKEYELEHKQDFDRKILELENDAKERVKNLKIDSRNLEKEKNALQKSREDYEEKSKELYRVIEKTSKMTRLEAQEVILNQIKEEEEVLIAKTIRRYEERAKEEAEKKAGYIIAQATTRFAGEYSAERLVNTIKLNSDDIKGRIIGKEGRNIKRLEAILGVDIIVDGTPRTITLSSFNLYRRSIAVKTIEKLIEDGRIQPARIEEIYEKVVKESDKDILKEGEEILQQLGISAMHPELIKLVGRLRYRASYGQNALSHSLEVAYLSGMMTAEIGGDEVLAKRAGLLHDIGKALTHENGGNHVDLGVEVCKKYGENEVVINAIYAHHEYEEAKTIEVATVCTADKLSAGRPGARREVLETSLKRIKKIEDIALAQNGVSTAYAVNSGRELRVIVNSLDITDKDAYTMSKNIAKEIEKKLEKFPGDIVVNVIRESRMKSVAKSL